VKIIEDYRVTRNYKNRKKPEATMNLSPSAMRYKDFASYLHRAYCLPDYCTPITLRRRFDLTNPAPKTKLLVARSKRCFVISRQVFQKRIDSAFTDAASGKKKRKKRKNNSRLNSIRV